MRTVIGGDALKRRILALGEAAQPMGRAWADETARQAKSQVPVRTGRLRKSIRRKNASKKRATVVAHFTATFVDAGTKAHTITAKKGSLRFTGAAGRTVFARSVHHRGARAHPFVKKAAHRALERTVNSDAFVAAWNKAA